MKVRELMTSAPASLGPDDTCAQAATLMREQDCGSIPIVQDGRLVGIVTDRDIVIRAVVAGRDPKTAKVSLVMSADPVTVGPDTEVGEASRIMADRQVRRLPVVENGHLVGILVTAQVARREDADDVGATIKDISEPASGRASHGRG